MDESSLNGDAMRDDEKVLQSMLSLYKKACRFEEFDVLSLQEGTVRHLLVEEVSKEDLIKMKDAFLKLDKVIRMMDDALNDIDFTPSVESKVLTDYVLSMKKVSADIKKAYGNLAFDDSNRMVSCLGKKMKIITKDI